MTVKFVDQAEFDATVKRLEERREAVRAAKRQKAKARSLKEKIEAHRALTAARAREV